MTPRREFQKREGSGGSACIRQVRSFSNRWRWCYWLRKVKKIGRRYVHLVHRSRYNGNTCNPNFEQQLQNQEIVVMNSGYRLQLEQLGLSPAEARVYLAVLHRGPMIAAAIAKETGIPRTGVYSTLGSLVDMGLIESGLGHRSKFTAVAPDRALTALIAQEEQALAHRKEIAKALREQLITVTQSTEAIPDEIIKVLRDPRSVSQHFQRLQLDARKTVEVFCKPPYLNPDDIKTERKISRRGIQVRGIYERGEFEDSPFKPYFYEWFSAGEEGRIYDGKLPHKMVIIDSEIVLLPLFTPGEEMRALVIRNAQLGESLSLAFRFIWARSVPVRSRQQKRATRSKTTAAAKAATPKSLNGIVTSTSHGAGLTINRGFGKI